jgi:N-carbamoylputrescine amidase
VLFPETALTGFIHRGDPTYDRELAIPIPGAETDRLGALARAHSLYVGIGILESAEETLFDTALLFNPAGQIVLQYRRISTGWHRRDVDLTVYCHGVDIPVADTPLGRFVFLICGDITYDDILDRVRALRADWLLFPMARGFDSEVHSVDEWEQQEVGRYADHVARAGTATMLVNYVGEMDQFYGGAVVFDTDGTVMASHPLHQPGVFIVDL